MYVAQQAQPLARCLSCPLIKDQVAFIARQDQLRDFQSFWCNACFVFTICSAFIPCRHYLIRTSLHSDASRPWRSLRVRRSRLRGPFCVHPSSTPRPLFFIMKAAMAWSDRRVVVIRSPTQCGPAELVGAGSATESIMMQAFCYSDSIDLARDGEPTNG